MQIIQGLASILNGSPLHNVIICCCSAHIATVDIFVSYAEYHFAFSGLFWPLLWVVLYCLEW